MHIHIPASLGTHLQDLWTRWWKPLCYHGLEKSSQLWLHAGEPFPLMPASLLSLETRICLYATCYASAAYIGCSEYPSIYMMTQPFYRWGASNWSTGWGHHPRGI